MLREIQINSMKTFNVIRDLLFATLQRKRVSICNYQVFRDRKVEVNANRVNLECLLRNSRSVVIICYFVK